MIAADTSTWVAFFQGSHGKDVEILDDALADRQIVMVPVVLTELLSEPNLSAAVIETLSEVPMIDIEAGYWRRAGALRAKALGARRKARLGDALIAQSCIDNAVSSLHETKIFERSPKLPASISSRSRNQCVDRFVRAMSVAHACV